MNRNAHRFALAAVVLVGVWIVTYWLWPAGDESVAAEITFDQPSATPTQATDADRPDPFAALSRPAVEPPATPIAAPEQPRPRPAASQAQRPARPRPSGPAVLVPKFTEYTVRKGDTIITIAARLYGRQDHWQSIAKANPSIDPQKLRAGQVLRVPVDPDNIQGVVVNAPATPSAGSPSVEPPAGAPIEYVVRRGDTLSEIARSFYNKPSLWTVIVDANRDQISSPEEIRPGMKLKIPPVATEAAANTDR